MSSSESVTWQWYLLELCKVMVLCSASLVNYTHHEWNNPLTIHRAPSDGILLVPATMAGPEQAVEWNRLAMENHKHVLDYVKLLYFLFCFSF